MCRQVRFQNALRIMQINPNIRVQPEGRRRNMRNFEKITAISNNPTWWLTLATEGGRGGTAGEQLKMIE
jgi:hypothetical protein